MIKPLALLCFVCCVPTEVAETSSFAVLLEPYIKTTLVLIAFEQRWLRGNKPRPTKSGLRQPLTW